MKKQALLILVVAGLTGCYDNNNKHQDHITPTRDSVNDNTIDTDGLIEPPIFIVRPDNTYVDLTTGRKVKIRVDSISALITDKETGKVVDFIIDPSSKDTFDRKGRRVNNALKKGQNNSWSIDESKIR